MSKEVGETPNIDAFFKEIEELREAHKILCMIWNEFGPYGLPVPKEKTLSDRMKITIAIQNYFKFDDSE